VFYNLVQLTSYKLTTKRS